MKRAAIDRRVESLVKVLNRLRGCQTFSSCGGHSKRKCSTQVSQDSFYVNFELKPERTSWMTLQLIVWAAAEADRRRIRVTAWNSGDTLEYLAFELKGVRGASPGALAKLIRKILG